MFCRKCGSEIPSDSLFCSKCGEKRLVSTPEQPASSISDKLNTIKGRIFFLFKFSGQISRKTFIKYSLAITAVQIGIGCLIGTSREKSFGIFLFICLLLSLIPELSLGIRRMRDGGIPLVFIPICFFTMIYFSSRANYYTEEASIRYQYANHVWFTDQNLLREASSYMNTAHLYQAGAIGITLLSWGILASVPSRKKKE
nr:MAG TPA: zinc-ribbon domain protein [Caudoviricetes sp.]